MEALAAGTDVDDVVPEVADIATSDDPFAMFLAMAAAAEATSSIEATDASELALFDSAEGFLVEALRELSDTPESSLSRGGFGLDMRPDHGVLTVTPPPDLGQRLAVLPQSYLQTQKVTDSLLLATTSTAANAAIRQARDDAHHTSLWPDAHFLGPLHPILDWASDRALAKLARNEVFAIPGDVDSPTVLLVGTLTNRRGQVVGASYMTAQALSASALALSTHESARAALSELGLTKGLINSGAVDPARWQYLIPLAVENAARNMQTFEAAARGDIEQRVQMWSSRVDAWESEANALIQRQPLRERTERVADEHAIARSMLPSQTLVRPLLVIVPKEN